MVSNYIVSVTTSAHTNATPPFCLGVACMYRAGPDVAVGLHKVDLHTGLWRRGIVQRPYAVTRAVRIIRSGPQRIAIAITSLVALRVDHLESDHLAATNFRQVHFEEQAIAQHVWKRWNDGVGTSAMLHNERRPRVHVSTRCPERQAPVQGHRRLHLGKGPLRRVRTRSGQRRPSAALRMAVQMAVEMATRMALSSNARRDQGVKEAEEKAEAHRTSKPAEDTFPIAAPAAKERGAALILSLALHVGNMLSRRRSRHPCI
mmetsp:Transcript_88257/g.189444  ORF Transcript_88257/g.189444 Transcript_88257/m.189444 type:complete len:260 (-) Transcript_88257:32-811(-)